MAGIKGMGSPEQLPTQPGNQDPDLAELQGIASDPDFKELQSMGADFPAETAGTDQAVQDVGYNGPGSDLLEMGANAAPFVGGLAAGIPGAIFGSVPGAVAMGMTGAAAGTAAKDFILQNVLKRVPQQGVLQRIDNMESEAGASGLGEFGGLGMSKGLSAALRSKYGKATLDFVAEKSAKPLAALREVFDAERGKIFAAVDEMFAGKVTPLTSQEAGDYAKLRLAGDIRNKFSGFVKSYGELDAVAQEIPLRGFGDITEKAVKKDGVKGLRITGKTKISNPVTELTDRARTEFVDAPSKTYKDVKRFSDRLDQVANGRDYLAVAHDLRAEATKAAQDAAKYNIQAVREHANYLAKFADQVEGHYEDQIVGGLAKRVANGKATAQELQGFQRMMAAQGNPNVAIDPKNLAKYTKSVAEDYLKNKGAVREQYAAFRGLLEDIGENVRVNPERMGPRQFARALEEVPSERLMERAFDPKNAAAMGRLKKEYPQVYDTIARNKMSEIIAKNTKVGGEIDYAGIANTIKDLPEGAHKFLLDNPQYAMLERAVTDPRLEFLQAKQTGMYNRLVTELARIGEQTRVIGKRVKGPVAPKTAQIANQGAAQLSQMFRPGISEPQQ